MTLEELGFSAPRLIAGFSGGVVAALFLFRKSPAAAVSSVVAGTLTANYLGPAALHYLPDWAAGGATFIVGLSAMVICQGIIAAVQGRFKADILGGDVKP